MRMSPRMTASARTALAWLRSGRVSSVLAGLLMISTAALAAVGHVSPLHISDNPLAADLSHPLHLWSLLTAWAGATHLSPLTGVVTLLTVGIALERFIGACWDIGLEIGHSVRTPAQCAQAAREDITTMTALLERRRA